MIEEAVWSVEQCALRSWYDYLQACPGAEEDALAAARLDAGEEATRLTARAYAVVLESLCADVSGARPDRARLRFRLRRQPAPAGLAA
jgi:hypothetical protein